MRDVFISFIARRELRVYGGNLCNKEGIETWTGDRKGHGVISPFKASLGISLKVEIFDPPWTVDGITLAGVARSRCSSLFPAAGRGICNGTRVARVEQ